VAIIINLDVMLAKRKVKSKDLAELVGITEQNLSLIKTGKVKGIRLATLNAICQYLNCQPGDLLEYRESATPDGDWSGPGGSRDDGTGKPSTN
jgi:putative transcriptional regulator